MGHLNEQTLSELLDGGRVAEAEEHLAGCAVCREELDALQRLRRELRELPALEAPAHLWPRIETRLARGGRRARPRLGWPRLIALQVAALAAVFVLGLGLGRMLSAPGVGDGQLVRQAATEPASLAEAMTEVRRLGAQYDAALRHLQRLAREEGAPLPSVSEQRLAGLDMLVEASRTALAVEPADPVLNSYLFAALEQRDAVLREMGASPGSGSDVLWR